MAKGYWILQVIWPQVVHSVSPSLIVDLQKLLSGVSHDAIREYVMCCKDHAMLSMHRYFVLTLSVLHRGFNSARIIANGNVDAKRAESNPVAMAVDLVQKYNEYFTCNFEQDPSLPQATSEALLAIKAVRPGNTICEEAHSILDPMRTSLLLLGKTDSGTGFHVDRTQAENIAFPIVNKTKVQNAVQVFCR